MLCPGCGAGSNPCAGARSQSSCPQGGCCPTGSSPVLPRQEHQDQLAGTGQSQHGQWSVPRCLTDLLLSQDPEGFLLLLLLLHQYFSFLAPEPVLLPGNLCLYQKRQWDMPLLLDSCPKTLTLLAHLLSDNPPWATVRAGSTHSPAPPPLLCVPLPTPRGQSSNPLPSGKLKSHPAHQNYLTQ